MDTEIATPTEIVALRGRARRVTTSLRARGGTLTLNMGAPAFRATGEHWPRTARTSTCSTSYGVISPDGRVDVVRAHGSAPLASFICRAILEHGPQVRSRQCRSHRSTRVRGTRLSGFLLVHHLASDWLICAKLAALTLMRARWSWARFVLEHLPPVAHGVEPGPKERIPCAGVLEEFELSATERLAHAVSTQVGIEPHH